MSADLSVDNSAVPSGRQLRQISQAALNRTIERARTLAGRKTVETYNLSTRQIAPYVRARKVTIKSDRLEGSVDLRIRAIPIEVFRPQVVMKTITYTLRGKIVTRRVATIELQRFRSGTPKLVRPAFSLTQRRTGRLRAGEKVRRRIGKERDKLTKIRYYTFPRKFVAETLAPAVKVFAVQRIRVELDAAFRAFSARTAKRTSSRSAARTLRRNRT